MIITRTPFRVTLGGGGTDLPSYYGRHGGFIFAMGIDKYMYIMLNPPTMDDRIRLHYSRSETVDHVSELRHELAREALRLHGIERKIEISSMADLPDGTGLGSSSAYLVGLLMALRQFKRQHAPLQEVAEEACRIELDILGKRIGKQDQYLAVYGGLTWAANSILPSLVLHVGGDIWSLGRLWLTGRPEWQLPPSPAALIRETGVDKGVLIAIASLAMLTAVTVAGYRAVRRMRLAAQA